MKIGKQILILILLSMFGFSVCFSQPNFTTNYENNDFKYLNIELNGNANGIMQITQKLKQNEIDTLMYSFDSLGVINKITLNTWYSDFEQNQDATAISIFLFNAGNLISAFEKQLPETGYVNLNDFDYTYKYDSIGNLLTKKSFIKNCLVSEDIHEYDEYNRLIRKNELVYGYFNRINKQKIPKDKSKYLSFVYNYWYDNSGNKIAETMDNIKSDIHKKYYYTYDSIGNLIEDGWIQNYQESDKIEPLFGYKYNYQGNLILKFCIATFSPHNTDTYYQYDENGNQTDVKGYYIASNDTTLGYHFVYKYDSLGNQIEDEMVVGSFRRLNFDDYKKLTTQFDSHNNIIRQEYITEDNDILKSIRYVYTYDNYRNWIRKERYETYQGNSEETIEIQERIIEYY